MNFEGIDDPALLAKYSWLILTAAALALAFLIAILLFRVFAEDAQQAPNSRIALQLGKSFKPSDRFSGFVDDESSTSIVIIELPAEAYEQVKGIGENPEALAAQGVTGVERAALKGRAGEYVYFTGEQTTALVDYKKFILIFRESEVAAMITVNAPAAALQSRAIAEADIEAMLASAEVKEAPRTSPALFELSYLGPFEEDLSLLGNTKGYRLKSDAGQARDAGALRPFFLVAPSLHKLPLPQIEETARKAFLSLDQFREAQIAEVKPVAAAGLDGLEIIGEAADWKTGQPAGLYQALLPARGGGYFRLVGFGPKADWETYLPEFRKITLGFRPLAGAR